MSALATAMLILAGVAIAATLTAGAVRVALAWSRHKRPPEPHGRGRV